MYAHLPTSMTHTKSRAHLSSYFPTVYSTYKSRITSKYFMYKLKMAIVKRRNM